MPIPVIGDYTPPKLIVRAVPERTQHINYLKRYLPDALWCFDLHHDAMDTFQRALLMAGTGAAVHMEEDILLTREFRAKLMDAIALRPRVMIQFFSMRGADKTVGSRWDKNYMMSQCTYYPPGYSALIAAFQPIWMRANPQCPTGYDLLVRDWLKLRGEPYWLHVPSLVDHRVAKSLIDPRRSSKRQSKTFTDPLP